MGDFDLTPEQRRTLAAREAFQRKYAATPEQARAHFAQLARRKAGGIQLTADETAALLEAYSLLSRAAARARRKLTAAGAPAGLEGNNNA